MPKAKGWGDLRPGRFLELVETGNCSCEASVVLQGDTALIARPHIGPVVNAARGTIHQSAPDLMRIVL